LKEKLSRYEKDNAALEEEIKMLENERKMLEDVSA
jgi:cell division protein FtsB